MKKIIFSAISLAFLTLAPLAASAHERQVFDIGGTKYLFVVGSLNEPVAVDDKSGVDLRIKIADPNNPGDSASIASKPVAGLDQTLKVELSAGGKKKVMNLTPAYGDPGAYRAVFFPTVQTTFTYRVFGSINNTPVNLSFSCNPAGHPAGEENKEVVVVSEGVSRVLQVGAFGCPTPKEELGFPELAPTLNSLATVPVPAPDNSTPATVALILAVIAILVSLGALKKGR